MRFSILRYASGLETVAGLVVVAAIAALAGPGRMRVAIGAAWVSAALLLATTVHPNWDRRRLPSDFMVDLSVPQLAPGTLVVLLVDTPASNVAI